MPVLYSTWGRHDGDAPNAAYGYGDFLGMTALTTRGYEMYAGALAAAPTSPTSPTSLALGAGTRGRGHEGMIPHLAPLVAPCGRAFELVHNSSGDAPLSPSSMFSCLYNHKAQRVHEPPHPPVALNGGSSSDVLRCCVLGRTHPPLPV